MKTNILRFEPFSFDGQEAPRPEDLSETLRRELQAGEVRWIHAAILHSPFAAALESLALHWLEADEDSADAYGAVLLIEALSARSCLDQLLETLIQSPDWFARSLPKTHIQRDPRAAATESVAEYATQTILRLSPSGGARSLRLQRWGWAYPPLRLHLWAAWPPTHPPIEPLPYLGEFLGAHPERLEESGARFALLHREYCLEAARVLRVLPEETRSLFYETLAKHLDRVGAIKLKVSCRRALGLFPGDRK